MFLHSQKFQVCQLKSSRHHAATILKRRFFFSSGMSERCFSNWWSWGPATGGESVTLQRPATQLQTTTQTTSWWASLSSLQPVKWFYSVKSCVSTWLVYIVHPQNEPTFYTEDGTPFTAADPGSRTCISLAPLGLGEMTKISYPDVTHFTSRYHIHHKITLFVTKWHHCHLHLHD